MLAKVIGGFRNGLIYPLKAKIGQYAPSDVNVKVTATPADLFVDGTNVTYNLVYHPFVASYDELNEGVRSASDRPWRQSMKRFGSEDSITARIPDVCDVISTTCKKKTKKHKDQQTPTDNPPPSMPANVQAGEPANPTGAPSARLAFLGLSRWGRWGFCFVWYGVEGSWLVA